MTLFSDSERHIISLFAIGSSFLFQGTVYTIINSGKPYTSKGEPKTDIYVLAQNQSTQIEFKISYKKTNADFLENKISAQRAELIFGRNWQNIISTATKSLQASFYNKRLIYPESYGRTQAGSITLGWKFEFVNVPSGELSGIIPLTFEQKADIYSGINLAEDKRNALVNGMITPNSGVANYMIVNNNVSTLDEAIQSLIPINSYATQGDIYFACKALNCRTFHPDMKWDGDRPLAVQVYWEIINNLLCPRFNFDTPLIVKGNEVGMKLLSSLNALGITNASQLNATNCSIMHIE